MFKQYDFCLFKFFTCFIVLLILYLAFQFVFVLLPHFKVLRLPVVVWEVQAYVELFYYCILLLALAVFSILLFVQLHKRSYFEFRRIIYSSVIYILVLFAVLTLFTLGRSFVTFCT